MLKFNSSCAVLAYLSSNLLNEVGLPLFWYFEVGLRVCDIVVKKFTFAISSPDEFLYLFAPDPCSLELSNPGYATGLGHTLRNITHSLQYYLRHVYTWIGKRTWLVISTVLSKLKDSQGHRQSRAV